VSEHCPAEVRQATRQNTHLLTGRPALQEIVLWQRVLCVEGCEQIFSNKENGGNKNMGLQNASQTIKPSDLPAFSGAYAPVGTDGTQQVASALVLGGFGDGSFLDNDVLAAVPAATRLAISGTGVTTLVPGTQYACAVSLTAGTLALSAATLDATNNQSNASPLDNVKWVSRNSYVATVNDSGLVTLRNRGEVEIAVRYSRAVNLPFDGARPSNTEFVDATLQLKVLR
jgi:hypothetical protein